MEEQMDILVYLVINVFLLLFIVLAVKFWRWLGTVGGLIGMILSYYVYNSENLIIRAIYNPATSEFVYSTTSMGFFAYIPIVLTITNLIVVFLKGD